MKWRNLAKRKVKIMVAKGHVTTMIMLKLIRTLIRKTTKLAIKNLRF